MAKPSQYLNERKNAITRLQKELQSCSPAESPLLRAENNNASIALVPGFDIDLRPDIEQANIADGEAGSGFVMVMGKPFLTASTTKRRTSSPIRTTSPPAELNTRVCSSPNP